MQCKKFVTGVSQAYFCVRTCHKNGLHLEQLSLDQTCIDIMLVKCSAYFHKVLLKALYDASCGKTLSDDITLVSGCVSCPNVDTTVTDFNTALYTCL